jgi:transcriptional regulator with XRE-family HTH domain
MARREKHHIISDAPGNPTTVDAPRHLSKQEFGRRLEKFMAAKKWNQSDLARHTGMARNNISVYVNGKSYPSESNLVKLAKALGVTPDELLPNRAELAIRGETMPDLSLKASIGDPGRSWLTINRLVPTGLAARIIGMLENERAKED